MRPSFLRRAPTCAYACGSSHGWRRVEVEDSGAGIPETFRSRVFEKFAQADSSAQRRFEGAGLGLSIARKLIEAMGGRIGFSTVTGQGSIFYIELPLSDTATAAPAGQLDLSLRGESKERAAVPASR
jgi:signal transduction histidine kinase